MSEIPFISINSTTGKVALLFMMNGPMTQGNLISEDFLKLMKCSFSTINFYLMKSRENILGVRNVGIIYGS